MTTARVLQVGRDPVGASRRPRQGHRQGSFRSRSPRCPGCSWASSCAARMPTRGSPLDTSAAACDPGRQGGHHQCRLPRDRCRGGDDQRGIGRRVPRSVAQRDGAGQGPLRRSPRGGGRRNVPRAAEAAAGSDRGRVRRGAARAHRRRGDGEDAPLLHPDLRTRAAVEPVPTNHRTSPSPEVVRTG
jgi:hypothetical protein